MLVGELPDLEETQSGKDLIAIGEKRGEKRGEQRGRREGKREGKIASILVYLEAKYKQLPSEVQKALSTLSSSNADRLAAHLPRCKSLRDVIVVG